MFSGQVRINPYSPITNNNLVNRKVAGGGTVADRHLEFKKKIKVLEYGFMLIFNILEPGVKSTKNIQIEGVHIEYFCSMLS